jgi:hypothetical protein
VLRSTVSLIGAPKSVPPQMTKPTNHLVILLAFSAIIGFSAGYLVRGAILKRPPSSPAEVHPTEPRGGPRPAAAVVLPRIVSGLVQDMHGLPVPAAFISDVGAQRIGTRSDSSGHFSLSVAGRGATLAVEKAGFVEKRVRIESFENASGANDPRAGDLTIVLSGAGTISGRVTDEHGEPLFRARVRVWTISNLGATTLRSLYPTLQGGVMQDRVPNETVDSDFTGHYRIDGVPGGEYYVSAAPPTMSQYSPRRGDIDGLVLFETFAGQTTCGPCSRLLAVRSGSVTNADIQLISGAPARVGVLAVTSSGRPIGKERVRVVGVRDGEAGFVTRVYGYNEEPGGRFELLLEPRVTIQLSVTSEQPWVRPGVQRPIEFATRVVDVTAATGAASIITTRPGCEVIGRVSDPSLSASAFRDFRVMPVQVDGQNVPVSSAPVSEDGRFVLLNVFGKSRIDVNTAGVDKQVGSVRLANTSVDAGVECHSGETIGPLEISLVNKSNIVGSLVGASDDSAIIVYPKSEGEWSHPFVDVRVVWPTRKGTFQVDSLRPGQYWIAVAQPRELDEPLTNLLLARLKTQARQLTLHAGQTASVGTLGRAHD